MWLKVTNEQECHHDFQYRDGLNIDVLQFQNEGSCVPGGLYFTDRFNISEYYEYGTWLREVQLPIDDPDFKMVRDPMLDKWRANMIFLRKKHDLRLKETYDRLSIPYPSIRICAIKGWVEILDIIYEKRSGFTVEEIEDVVFFAIHYRHIPCLDFLKTRCDIQKHINIDACHDPELLQWWKDSGIDRRYTEQAMNFEMRCDVLQWWKDSGLELKYSERAMHHASLCDAIDVLDWWIHSGLQLRLPEFPCRYSYDVMKWWTESRLDEKRYPISQ